MVFLLLEAGRGKPVDKDTEALINYAGYALLILSAIYLFARDLDTLALYFLSGEGTKLPG